MAELNSTKNWEDCGSGASQEFGAELEMWRVVLSEVPAFCLVASWRMYA